MSAQTAVTPDTLVTAKVTYLGNIRRFKLALRDLNAATFENKLKELLSIPAEQTVVFERYSDSASSWVKLDAANIAVYKQLYRAAKAKLKLRIRATVVPSPDSLIDAVDAMSIQTSGTLLPSYSSVQVNQVPSPSSAPTQSTESIDEAVARAVNSHFNSAQFTEKLQETVRTEVEKQAPPPPPPAPVPTVNPDAPATGTLSVLPDPASFFQNASGFAIYCNNCNNNIKGVHYHCQQCDSGDFDLCKKCTDQGVHCNDQRHWLMYRELLDDGRVTWNGEGVYAKTKDVEKPEEKDVLMRLCNSCGHGMNSEAIVKCVNCKDYDLCLGCFRTGAHGHDPRHEFKTEGDAKLSTNEMQMLKPGRNERHNAICDGCETQIRGIRHKCIDCVDFDYCTDCVKDSKETHRFHRFLPVYGQKDVGPLMQASSWAQVMHYGVYCDGPRCSRSRHSACIRGVRYKCAICPDTDFCGFCEASPDNKHNITHPLIKMKTPIRHVLVTTTDNNDMVMGDLSGPVAEKETTNSATQVQTIADVKPTEEVIPEVKQEVEVKPEPVKEVEVPALKIEEKPKPATPKPEPLRASFVSDSVADGTTFTVGQAFTQTWIMSNTGTTAWPAGITVSFAGGDYMFLKSDLGSLKATVTDEEVPVGGIRAFSVNLSATWPPSKHYISYWRLTAPDGSKFGDNIWCSINVVDEEKPLAEDVQSTHHDNYSIASVADTESVKDHTEAPETFESVHESMRGSRESEMIFPKLPVESPVHSVESLRPSESSSNRISEPIPISPVSNRTLAFSDVDLEEVSSVGDAESFLTDEEYDVLDASDEESFEECERVA